ncbi:MAG: tetratricopeptide repeat protein [Parvularculaceae bacterium]
MRLIVVSMLALAALSGESCASAPPQGNLSGDYLSGRLAARVNALDDAARVYAAAHAAAPQEIQLLKDAFFYQLAAGNVEAAIPYARAVLDKAPKEDDGLARATLAASEIKAGRYAEARAMLQGEINAPFVKSLAFLADVWIEKELAGPDAALLKLARPPAELFSGFNQFHEGLLAAEAGRQDQARTALEASVTGLGGPLARRAYGALLERADAVKAREYYAVLSMEGGAARRGARMAEERAAAGKPSTEYMATPAAQGVAAAVYAFSEAMIREAAEERRRAIDAGFKVGEPRFNFPLVWSRLALYLDPDLDEARYLVGYILNLYGDYAGASAVLAAIEPSSPYFEQARIDMASGLMTVEKRSEAERLLKDAARRDPKSRELKATLATYFAEGGDHARAVATLTAVIGSLSAEPPPDSWRYFIARSASLIELDRWDEAESDLKRAVELAPEEPTTLNYLGYSWAERGLNLEEAFALLEKAIAKAPDSGAVIDSLGWAQYQLGRYGEAALNLEKAASMEPSDPTITDHLGDAYWRLDRRIEARYQWRRALELDPAGEHKALLEGKIADGLKTAPEQKATDLRE